jgi:hypothetical protein
MRTCRRSLTLMFEWLKRMLATVMGLARVRTTTSGL